MNVKNTEKYKIPLCRHKANMLYKKNLVISVMLCWQNNLIATNALKFSGFL